VIFQISIPVKSLRCSIRSAAGPFLHPVWFHIGGSKSRPKNKRQAEIRYKYQRDFWTISSSICAITYLHYKGNEYYVFHISHEL